VVGGETVLGEGVAEDDPVRVLAFDHQVGPGDRPGFRVELLTEHLQACSGVELRQMLLPAGEHPAGAAGRVKHRPDRCGPAQGVVVLAEQDVDHEPDHLARGEVLSGCLVAHLRELPEQLFEDVAHRLVRNAVGVEVNVGEAGQDQIQQARVVEPGDLVVEAIPLDYFGRTRGEPRDVGAEVRRHVVGVVQQPREAQRADVVERLARDPGEDRIDVADRPGQPLRALRDGVPSWLQHTVQTTQDRQGQDDLAVLVGLEVASEQVGHRPNEPDLVPEPLNLHQPSYPRSDP
jgi:hypothetical protein